MTGGWQVPESEIEFRFVASGGPGGQHANRSNTKVDAVFRLDESPTMPAALRERVRAKLGDVVRVTVDDERSQTRNREIALERMRGRIRNAGVVEKPRRATKPTRGSQRRRVEAKRRRGDVKKGRRRPGDDD
ncbi:MAG: alternative ribosome rescue aminoacyl-tRNA hydrolase ArfB [Actinomycetota bacterium]